MTLPPGTRFYRVYRVKHGYLDFNPGTGESRFAPIHGEDGPVPTLYAGETQGVALLETVFHDVGRQSRLVYLADLVELGLVEVELSTQLNLVDLRDTALTAMGLDRHQLITSTAAHYPCTREWATVLHETTRDADRPVEGLIWHSRQAELVGTGPLEALVLFGDRIEDPNAHFTLVSPGVRNLVEGPVRILVDEWVEQLGLTLVHEDR